MIFYDHLILREEIVKELKNHKLTVLEHIEILKLADETIHLEILDVLLSNLPKEKHEEFLEKLHRAPHDKKLFDFFDDSIHGQIKARAQKARKVIVSEIKRSKKK